MKYTVSAGDNLITIAKKYQVSLKELMDLNSIKTPNLIYLGQEIDIPEDGEQLESKGLTGSNINAKIEDFINFLELDAINNAPVLYERIKSLSQLLLHQKSK